MFGHGYTGGKIINKREKPMNKFIKKILGIDKIEAATQQAIKEAKEAIAKIEQEKQLALAETEIAKEAERLAKLSPKELANEKKEPWVGVVETHVGKENVRNGFFELDWNELFVVQLRDSGFTGATEEDVVDQWFVERCRYVGSQEGIDMSKRGAGYVNRALRDDGMTEVF
jgi:hypothetical protein